MRKPLLHFNEKTFINRTALIRPLSDVPVRTLHTHSEPLRRRADGDNRSLDAIDLSVEQIHIDFAETDVFALAARPVGRDH